MQVPSRPSVQTVAILPNWTRQHFRLLKFIPSTQSIVRQAGAMAGMKVRTECVATAKVRKAHGVACKHAGRDWVPRNDISCNRRNIGSNAIVKKERPLAGHPSTPLAIGKCPLVVTANSTAVMPSSHSMRRNSCTKAGSPAPFNTRSPSVECPIPWACRRIGQGPRFQFQRCCPSSVLQRRTAVPGEYSRPSTGEDHRRCLW